MSARLATHQESAMLARQMAVSKAKRDLAEVEQKLRKLKAWTMSFDTAADPIVKQMDRLRQTLNDLAHAVTYLASVHKTLEAYAESAPAATLPASAPASSPEAGDAATTTEPA
jgi:DNA repair ATPase RecN